MLLRFELHVQLFHALSAHQVPRPEVEYSREKATRIAPTCDGVWARDFKFAVNFQEAFANATCCQAC